MIVLRVAVPPDLTEPVLAALDRPQVAQVSVYRGASYRPAGDEVVAEMAREGADEIVGTLRSLGVGERGALSLGEVLSAPYAAADAASAASPGASDDGVLWHVIERGAEADARPSWSYLAFLVLATLLAAIAVITDSSILVVGAMVVGPEFATVAAICVGLARGRPDIALRATGLLVAAFAVAIAVVTAVAWAASHGDWVTQQMVTRPRPMTGFIWHPDRWSVVVALLAGAAGVLSLTSGKANALVGVFISVTTVPAAGSLALALATGAREEIGGSALQLLVNVTGMVVAGVLTLWVQRLVWRRVERLRPRHSGIDRDPS